MPVATTDLNKHLETLGLSPEDLNEDAVRVAYKKLALRWHPDRHNADPEEAKQKFIEVNDAYKALMEECKRRKKCRRNLWRKDTEPSQRRPFWATSTRSASPEPSSRASSGTERTAKQSDPRRKDQDPSHSHPDSKPPRSSEPGPTAAPQSPRPRFRPSNRRCDRHRDTDTDSDASSEAGSVRTHAHIRDRVTSSGAKSKKPVLGDDDDYEFIDLGTPLKPLRSPRPFSASTKDWIFPLHLTLEDLYFGAAHRYRITRTLNNIAPAMPAAPELVSAGARRQTVQIDVHVAPGWTTGTRIRVPGVGNQRPDGSFQDIVFVVAEVQHPRFVRKGDDLILPVRVPWVDTHTRRYPSNDLGPDTDSVFGLGSGLGHGEPGNGVRYRVGRGAFCQMPPREEDEVYVRGIDGEEYTIPIPRTLVEAADGTRIYGAGMPIRKDGHVVGMGDMVIRWEFVFPESDRLQRSRWQTLKDAMHIKLPL
ncbi:hypothetical protein BD414DRAFT_538455 [Trametes punicea]|nr:hypothetical protein BD414DRAFT_538455 [Trametes punicea]